MFLYGTAGLAPHFFNIDTITLSENLATMQVLAGDFNPLFPDDG